MRHGREALLEARDVFEKHRLAGCDAQFEQADRAHFEPLPFQRFRSNSGNIGICRGSGRVACEGEKTCFGFWPALVLGRFRANFDFAWAERSGNVDVGSVPFCARSWCWQTAASRWVFLPVWCVNPHGIDQIPLDPGPRPVPSRSKFAFSDGTAHLYSVPYPDY